VTASTGVVRIECPSCGRERDVSARTARRGAGRCRFCLDGTGDIPEPDDEDRTWWLVRFDNQEIAELASFGRRPDRERIRSERERLLGVMGRAERVVALGT
jgi:hypothetical protein